MSFKALRGEERRGEERRGDKEREERSGRERRGEERRGRERSGGSSSSCCTLPMNVFFVLSLFLFLFLSISLYTCLLICGTDSGLSSVYVAQYARLSCVAPSVIFSIPSDKG